MHPARLRRVPSLHHCSRGRRTRAVPGPLRLSPHPCGSLPSTTIPLGLLMGPFASSVRWWAMAKRPNQRCVGWVERSDTHQSTVWVSRGSTHPTNIRRTCRSGPWPRYFGFCLLLCHLKLAQTTRSPNPVRRPSVGAVERGVWHGCQTRHAGPWMARLADPQNSTGAREVERSETRMPGALSLWLLSLCARKEKVTRRKGEKYLT